MGAAAVVMSSGGRPCDGRSVERWGLARAVDLGVAAGVR